MPTPELSNGDWVGTRSPRLLLSAAVASCHYGHAIANGLFIVVPNRTGCEGLITFYGGSFVTDPFGRVLAKAPDDREAALVVDIDINQREDWLQLFPFFSTRRPDTYGKLTEPRVNQDQKGAGVAGPSRA